MLSILGEIIDPQLKILIRIVRSEPPLRNTKLSPSWVGRSNNLALIDHQFISLSFSKNSKKGISSTKEIPPSNIGQSLSCQLKSQHLLFLLLFLLTPQDYLPRLLVSIDEVLD
jgi:hypothetical protein